MSDKNSLKICKYMYSAASTRSASDSFDFELVQTRPNHQTPPKTCNTSKWLSLFGAFGLVQTTPFHVQSIHLDLFGLANVGCLLDVFGCIGFIGCVWFGLVWIYLDADLLEHVQVHPIALQTGPSRDKWSSQFGSICGQTRPMSPNWILWIGCVWTRPITPISDALRVDAAL